MNHRKLLFMLFFFFSVTLQAKLTDEQKSIDYLDLVKKFRKSSLNETYIYLEKALEFAKKSKNDSLIAESYLYYAVIELEQSKTHSSLEYLDQVKQFANVNHSSQQGKIYNTYGRIYNRLNLLEKATEFFYKGLEQRQKTGKNTEIAASYVNMSITQTKLKNLKKAEKYLLFADSLYAQENDETGLSITANNLGTLYSDNKDYTRALQQYKKSYEYDKNNNNISGSAFSLLNIGDSYINLKEFKLANRFIDESYSIAKEFNNNSLIRSIEKTYGQLYFEQKQYKKAIDKFEKALDSSKDTEDYLFNSDIYSLIYKSYKNLKDYKQAFVFLEKYTQMRDSIDINESKKLASELEQQFNLKIRDQKISSLIHNKEELEKEISTNKILISVSIIALMLLLFIIFSGYFMFSKQHAIMEELQKSKLEIEKNKNDLHEYNKEKDLFFSIFSHDIKNLFMTLINSTEILVNYYKNLDDEKRFKYIKNIFASSTQIYSLLENLLQWSIIHSDEVKRGKTKIKLGSLANEISKLYKIQAENKNLDLVVISENIEIESDKNMLHTILRNLVSNSIKFSENGQITITVSEQKACVQISILDCGIGISDDKINEILNSDSVKSTRGTNKEKGTGIGLGITQKYISILGGNLTIKNIKNIGAEFVVEVPKK